MDNFTLKLYLGEIISAVSHGGTTYHVLPPAPHLIFKDPEDYTLREFCSRFASLNRPYTGAPLDDLWPVVRYHTARMFQVPPTSLTLQTVFRSLLSAP